MRAAVRRAPAASAHRPVASPSHSLPGDLPPQPASAENSLADLTSLYPLGKERVTSERAGEGGYPSAGIPARASASVPLVPHSHRCRAALLTSPSPRRVPGTGTVRGGRGVRLP